MKTLFQSQDLWDLVENGYSEHDEENRMKKSKKKDSKALFFIQQSVHETIFPRISAATTSKEAWTILRSEYQGTSKVVAVKKQTLRHEFETLHMKSNESVQEFMSRVVAIVNQMRIYGDKMDDELVVTKVLRSLAPRFDHVVAAIEESKDLSNLTVDELSGSLHAHEARINRSAEKSEDKVFQVHGEIFNARDGDKTHGRGHGRSSFRGRGRGRGRGRPSGDQRQFYGDQKNNRAHIKCHNCKKYRHVKAECWFKEKTTNVVEEPDVQQLFMTHCDSEDIPGSVWLVDSGCSNHMSGTRELFQDLDESQKTTIRLGDDKEMRVAGKGTIAFKTASGKVKLLTNVQYVPHLAHNLLSVGQLLANGYSVIFEDKECSIKDNKIGQLMTKIKMTKNKMFPLEVMDVEHANLITSSKNNTNLWHQRYGHLHIKGLKVLRQKNMVIEVPPIEEIGVCEGYILGKQSRHSFPSGKAWRASSPLELVHADVCGPMQTESLGGSSYFLLFVDDYTRMN